MAKLRLDADDSSILRFIARFPNNPTVNELISKLEGISREIALDIIGKNTNASSEVRKATEDIKDWTEKEKQRILMGKTGKRKLIYSTKEEIRELEKNEEETYRKMGVKFKTFDKEEEKKKNPTFSSFAGAMIGGAFLGLFLGSQLGYGAIGAAIGATVGFIVAKAT